MLYMACNIPPLRGPKTRTACTPGGYGTGRHRNRGLQRERESSESENLNSEKELMKTFPRPISFSVMEASKKVFICFRPLLDLPPSRMRSKLSTFNAESATIPAEEERRGILKRGSKEWDERSSSSSTSLSSFSFGVGGISLSTSPSVPGEFSPCLPPSFPPGVNRKERDEKCNL